MGEALLARTDVSVIRRNLGLASFYLGDAARAREVLGGAQRGGQASSNALAALAGVLAATGERERAREIVRTVRSGSFADNHHVAYGLGAALAHLGERDDALRSLRQAVDGGLPCYPFFAADPLLQPLRNDAGFQGFMAGLRAAYESARATYSKNPTPARAQSLAGLHDHHARASRRMNRRATRVTAGPSRRSWQPCAARWRMTSLRFTQPGLPAALGRPGGLPLLAWRVPDWPARSAVWLL